MNWLITENKKRVSINEIPVLNIGDLRLEIIKLSKRVIGFFGKREDEKVRLFVARCIDVRNAFFGVRRIRYGQRGYFRVR